MFIKECTISLVWQQILVNLTKTEVCTCFSRKKFWFTEQQPKGNTLNLNVKHGGWVDGDSRCFLEVLGKLHLVACLDLNCVTKIWSSNFLYMNKNTWNSLKPRLRTIVTCMKCRWKVGSVANGFSLARWSRWTVQSSPGKCHRKNTKIIVQVSIKSNGQILNKRTLRHIVDPSLSVIEMVLV